MNEQSLPDVFKLKKGDITVCTGRIIAGQPDQDQFGMCYFFEDLDNKWQGIISGYGFIYITSTRQVWNVREYHYEWSFSDGSKPDEVQSIPI